MKQGDNTEKRLKDLEKMYDHLSKKVDNMAKALNELQMLIPRKTHPISSQMED